MRNHIGRATLPTIAIASIVILLGPASQVQSQTQVSIHDLRSDPRAVWLKEHATRVRSVDFADDDFSDLQQLKAAIGDARVVGLGERNHGDGTTHRAKARLIRFLHEQMGFDVLVFEAGFYDIAKSWELVAREDSVAALQRGLFSNAGRSAEDEPLLKYVGAVAKTAHPLEIAGLDCQLSGSASTDFLLDDLRRFLAAIDIPTNQLSAGSPFARTLEGLHVVSGTVAPHPPDDAFLASLVELRRMVAVQVAARRPRDGAFWMQVLKNIEAETRSQIIAVQERQLQEVFVDQVSRFSLDTRKRLMDPDTPSLQGEPGRDWFTAFELRRHLINA